MDDDKRSRFKSASFFILVWLKLMLSNANNRNTALSYHFDIQRWAAPRVHTLRAFSLINIITITSFKIILCPKRLIDKLLGFTLSLTLHLPVHDIVVMTYNQRAPPHGTHPVPSSCCCHHCHCCRHLPLLLLWRSTSSGAALPLPWSPICQALTCSTHWEQGHSILLKPPCCCHHCHHQYPSTLMPTTTTTRSIKVSSVMTVAMATKMTMTGGFSQSTSEGGKIDTFRCDHHRRLWQLHFIILQAIAVAVIVAVIVFPWWWQHLTMFDETPMDNNNVAVRRWWWWWGSTIPQKHCIPYDCWSWYEAIIELSKLRLGN